MAADGEFFPDGSVFQGHRYRSAGHIEGAPPISLNDDGDPMSGMFTDTGGCVPNITFPLPLLFSMTANAMAASSNSEVFSLNSKFSLSTRYSH